LTAVDRLSYRAADALGGYVERGRRQDSNDEGRLRGILRAGFLVLPLLAWLGWVTPAGAADDHEAALATSSGSAEEPCSFWGNYDTASKKPCVWDDYDPKQAGHPLRIAAYLLHPVGVVIDRLIFRPAWWIGSHEPFHTLFGRTD
jgi:hypothetical protein